MNDSTAVQEEETPSYPVCLGRILIVDDDEPSRQALAVLLVDEGYLVEQTDDAYKGLGCLRSFKPDIVLTDLRMPLMTGIEFIEKSKDIEGTRSFVVMTGYGSVDDAVRAMKTGADDFLTKPLNFDAVKWILQRTMKRLEMAKELAKLRASNQLYKKVSNHIPAASESMKQAIELGHQVANSRATLLISGEPGTGKEFFAKYLHKQSKRAKSPFYSLHCASMPDSLIEAELFGYAEGAQGPNSPATPGRLEQTHGGTLFLDEITQISPKVQVQLLEFLQTKKFRPIGSSDTKSVDVRIMAASTYDIEGEVRVGRFREDLYYRINVVRIDIPPLRSRRPDIAHLVNVFVHRYAKENDKNIEEVSPDFIAELEAHDWPGNVRELENLIERAVVLCNDNCLDIKHLPRSIGNLSDGQNRLGSRVIIPGSSLADIERFAIIQTYQATGGRTSETATILQISQRKVQYKLREYRVEELGEDFDEEEDEISIF